MDERNPKIDSKNRTTSQPLNREALLNSREIQTTGNVTEVDLNFLQQIAELNPNGEFLLWRLGVPNRTLQKIGLSFKRDRQRSLQRLAEEGYISLINPQERDRPARYKILKLK